MSYYQQNKLSVDSYGQEKKRKYLLAAYADVTNKLISASGDTNNEFRELDIARLYAEQNMIMNQLGMLPNDPSNAIDNYYSSKFELYKSNDIPPLQKSNMAVKDAIPVPESNATPTGEEFKTVKNGAKPKTPPISTPLSHSNRFNSLREINLTGNLKTPSLIPQSQHSQRLSPKSANQRMAQSRNMATPSLPKNPLIPRSIIVKNTPKRRLSGDFEPLSKKINDQNSDDNVSEGEGDGFSMETSENSNFSSHNKQSQNDKNPPTENSSHSNKKEKIPPVIVKDDISWAEITAELKCQGITKYTGKIYRDSKKIYPADSDTHRKITKILTDKSIKHHTFVLPEDKHFRVVIKGLPKESDIDEIKNELTYNGIVFLDIIQLTKRRDGVKHLLPVFLVTLPKSDNAKEIYNIEYMTQLRITVEKYNGRPGPSQCHRCQSFHHSARFCTHDPKCVKCGGDHLSHTCQKTRDTPATCANCGGDHPANYTKCSAFPKLNEIKTTSNMLDFIPSRVITGKSYADTLRSVEINETESLKTELKETISEAKNLIEQLKNFVELFSKLNFSNLTINNSTPSPVNV